jgi:hypothetical protein
MSYRGKSCQGLTASVGLAWDEPSRTAGEGRYERGLMLVQGPTLVGTRKRSQSRISIARLPLARPAWVTDRPAILANVDDGRRAPFPADRDEEYNHGAADDNLEERFVAHHWVPLAVPEEADNLRTRTAIGLCGIEQCWSSVRGTGR